MPILAAPYEIFDIGDGESVDITVTRWERGDEIEMKATDGHTFPRLLLKSPLTDCGICVYCIQRGCEDGSVYLPSQWQGVGYPGYDSPPGQGYSIH
jgi:hypothetical protein